MARVFLETTIQVRRLLYDGEERRQIDQLLTEHQTLTSTYVWMEVQRTIGQDYQTAIQPDFALAKGEQTCWSLGDLIIVLECPPDAALWTTNVRHFAPLCQVFGRQLFQPPVADGQKTA